MDDDDRTLAAALQQHADRLTDGLIDSSDAYETVARRARTRRGRWMFVTAGLAAAAALVGCSWWPAQRATGRRSAAQRRRRPRPRRWPRQPPSQRRRPTPEPSRRPPARRRRDVDDRHVASGAAGRVASGAADNAGCRADDRDVRGDRRVDHRPLDWGHADARHRPGAVAGLHGQRGRQRTRPGPCPLRARRPAHRDPVDLEDGRLVPRIDEN